MRGTGTPLALSRRSLLSALLASGGVLRSIRRARAATSPRQASRDALKDVAAWGCQYQRVDLDAIARSGLDLIVVDPCLDDARRRFVTPSECAAIKRRPDGSRRLALAYASAGEADTKRWYWPAEWRGVVPDWVGPENPLWPGARSINYWHAEWQDLLFAGAGSILDMIVDAGFDGVFLDRVDAYGDWGSGAAEITAMADMVAAIGAKARRRNPGFIVMMQNAEHVLDHVNLLDAIDAHSKESLLTGLDGHNVPNRQDDVDWSLSRLRPLQARGIPTFAIEYVSDPVMRGDVGTTLRNLGFKPFFGTPALDRLPSADPDQGH